MHPYSIIVKMVKIAMEFEMIIVFGDNNGENMGQFFTNPN